MRNNYLFFLVFAAGTILFNTGCTTSEVEHAEPELFVSVEKLTGEQPVIFSDISEAQYPVDYAEGQEKFDWENLQYLPLPSSEKPVPMPWNRNAKTMFSADLRNDYKKSDGWELYLSNFSSKFRMGNLSFSLYNKYRGVLRYYFFIGSGTQRVQDFNILRNDVVGSEGSPLLNFTNQYIVDVDKKVNQSIGFEPQPFADSTWYAVEYELAFDKNIYQKDERFQLGILLSMVKKHALQINGKTVNDLKTSIRVLGVNDLSGNSTSADAYFQILGNEARQVSELYSEPIINAQNTLEQNSILSGLLTAPTLSLKWDVSIDLQLQPNGVGIMNESFFVGGANLSSVQGLAPFYDNALGIFYLNKKPTYTFTKLSASENPYQYKLDVKSVEYLFNPSVLKVAEIKNIQQELVATEKEQLRIDNKRQTLFSGHVLKSNKPLSIQGVRVSFDVVPKDGTEKVHIIKTFKAEPSN